MSRTDNTRPIWVQYDDTTLPGYISHSCTRDQHGMDRHSPFHHKAMGPKSVDLLMPDGNTIKVTRRPNGGLSEHWERQRQTNGTYEKVVWRTRRHTGTWANLIEVWGAVGVAPDDFSHTYRKNGQRRREVQHDCDFLLNGNVTNQVMRRSAGIQRPLSVACTRQPLHSGGERYLGGAMKTGRQQLRTQYRARERQALEQVRRSNFEDDFELLPRRSDAKTLKYDLS